MGWQKLGLIFRPGREASWMATHACLPLPVMLDERNFRVFFAGRDRDNRSHIGWFDIDLGDPLKGVRTNDKVFVSPGPLGHFDDHGIYPGSAVRLGDKLRIYTIGWNPGIRPPLFYASIGVLETSDFGMTCDFRGSAPVLARSGHDPCHVTGPCVLNENGRWRMWYVSGLRWVETPEGPKSRYHIKYADSDDGIDWRRDGTIAIDLAQQNETNIARPWVLKAGDHYDAWFSFERGEGYRIGYGRSKDGFCFARDPAASPTIDVSKAEFETHAVCHPAVVTCQGKRFMFYNGNRFGIDGIAIAVETP
jgi:hypothetical protein